MPYEDCSLISFALTLLLQTIFSDFILFPKGCFHDFSWKEGYGELSEWYIIGSVVQVGDLAQEEEVYNGN